MLRPLNIFFLLVIACFGNSLSHAQIETSVTGLEQIKDWRKLNKEKLRELKKHQKKIVSQAEQLGDELLDDKYLAPYYEAKKYKSEYGPLADSLRGFAQKDLGDSTVQKQAGEEAIPQDLKQSRDKAKTYAEQFENYDEQLKENQQMQDSLAGTLEMMAKRYVKHPAYSNNLVKSYEENLKARENQVQGIGQEAEGMSDQEQMRQQLMQRAKQLGTNHFAGQTEKVEAAQKKLSKLKKKYSYVPNSNDLSTARKANSLEGEPLKKRLSIGGTLQIHAGKPVGVDFNPQIGYRIHKKWTAGLGGTYRSSFGSGERFFSGEEHEVYGGRLYTDYTFFKSFFAHGEFEMLHSNIVDPDTEEMHGLWSKGLMTGVGKHYKFMKKVRGSIMVLYNFLHERPGPYQRPWVVRFGFEVK